MRQLRRRRRREKGWNSLGDERLRRPPLGGGSGGGRPLGLALLRAGLGAPLGGPPLRGGLGALLRSPPLRRGLGEHAEDTQGLEEVVPRVVGLLQEVELRKLSLLTSKDHHQQQPPLLRPQTSQDLGPKLVLAILDERGDVLYRRDRTDKFGISSIFGTDNAQLLQRPVYPILGREALVAALHAACDTTTLATSDSSLHESLQHAL
mmetsp:Transcript_99543/g.262848  ORF Transcript_99543/g.262848 Transcript_99543/m.262848 type:complete len:206 (-) Transcript_99543:375-992(-)